MKSRMLVSMLVIALAAAVIGGATMAWFTDDAEVADVTFTAGTLEIAAGEAATIDPENFDNVNPGDDYTVCWNIENVGSKAVALRVDLNGVWDFDEPTDKANVTISLADDSNWVVGADGLFYYDGDVAGTYGADEGVIESAELCVVVAFDGESMGNDYQGEKYELSGEVEAVQSSNNAPQELWGDDFGDEG